MLRCASHHYSAFWKSLFAGRLRRRKEEVVVLSKQAYDELIAGSTQPAWRTLLKEAHESICAALAGRELPDPAEIIRQGREERDEQLRNAMR